MRDRHGDPILVDLRPDSDSPVRRASFAAISCGMTYPPAMLRYRVGPNSSGAIPRLASTYYCPHITRSFGRAILSASRIVFSTCTIVNPLRSFCRCLHLSTGNVSVQRLLARAGATCFDDFVPGNQGCCCAHDGDSDDADQDLHFRTTRYFDQDKMSREGEEYAEAKDFERILSAKDNRTK